VTEPTIPTRTIPTAVRSTYSLTDWSTEAGQSDGGRIANWIIDHRLELGVTYMIWHGQIWSSTRAAEDWRPYTQ
jgi:hypothetical protein